MSATLRTDESVYAKCGQSSDRSFHFGNRILRRQSIWETLKLCNRLLWDTSDVDLQRYGQSWPDHRWPSSSFRKTEKSGPQVIDNEKCPDREKVAWCTWNRSKVIWGQYHTQEDGETSVKYAMLQDRRLPSLCSLYRRLKFIFLCLSTWGDLQSHRLASFSHVSPPRTSCTCRMDFVRMDTCCRDPLSQDDKTQ